MTDKEIIDIFYNQIVPEAKQGRVDCYFMMNILFDLVINNNQITKSEKKETEGILIPTLKITNKDLFEKKLTEYVKRASIEYDDSDFSFLNDITEPLEGTTIEKTRNIYKTKYIICTLLANATSTDYLNPINFIDSRLKMFDNKLIKENSYINLGYINSINASIFIKEEKCSIRAETPYRIKSYLIFDDNYKLELPELYIASDKDKYKLYGIQQEKGEKKEENLKYIKQIRKGFIAKINGAPEHYFLAVMLLLSLCNDKEIEVVPFLISRWNAKRIAINKLAEKNQNISISEKEMEQILIQNNITNILMRYFTKLKGASKGLEIGNLPYDIDEYLHIYIDDSFESRSKAFNEIYELVNNYKNNKKKKPPKL